MGFAVSRDFRADTWVLCNIVELVVACEARVATLAGLPQVTRESHNRTRFPKAQPVTARPQPDPQPAMDSIAALGAIEIGPSVMPTRNALYPLLDAHADLIRSVDKRTFVYGEKRKRQIADVYYPPAGAGVGPGAGEGEGAPVLVFFYGQ